MARLRSTADVFETGMNAAVSLLAEAAANKGGRGARTPAEPIKVLGAHPTSGSEMKVLAGRYGPYVTDGITNATLPRDSKPEDLTAEAAIVLIDEKAAKAPTSKTRKKAPAKQAAAKKAPAKKAPAKKASAGAAKTKPKAATKKAKEVAE